jgi:hypothetical protein
MSTRMRRGIGALVATTLTAMAGQILVAAPAQAAECVTVAEDGSGNASLRVCANAAVDERGYPVVTFSVTKDYEPENGPPPLVIFKTSIQEGEDIPRTLSVGAGIVGAGIVVGVDLSGSPERTNVCIRLSEPGTPWECFFLGDLLEPPAR